MKRCGDDIRAPFAKRLAAFFVDFILISFIMNIGFAILVTIYTMMFAPQDEEVYYRSLEIFYSLFMVVSFLVFAVKDMPNGQSVGKKFMKLAVKDSLNVDQIPRKSKLFLRNILTLLWPLELLTYLIKGEKMGDIIAKTVVVNVFE